MLQAVIGRSQVKKVLLKVLDKLQEKICAGVSFLIGILGTVVLGPGSQVLVPKVPSLGSHSPRFWDRRGLSSWVYSPGSHVLLVLHGLVGPGSWGPGYWGSGSRV